MVRRARSWLLVLTALWCAGGCAKARYVHKGPDEGVVAMPKDSPRVRKQAEELMAGHFPDGYEVVFEYEEKVGESIRENAQTDVGPSPSFMLFSASKDRERSSGVFQAAGVVPGPGGRRTTTSTTTVTDKTEWRIRYRRKRPPGSTGGEQSISHIPPKQ